MIVLDNNNDAWILDSIHTPTAVEYMWVLDLNILDFTLAPLQVLEEIVSPTIELMIDTFRFAVPANWNILICDSEIMTLDVIQIGDVAGKDFRALVYGPNQPRIHTKVIQASNFFPSHVNVAPSLNKHQMLCHPISPTTWINIAPSDSYNKYLKNLVAGDLI